MGVCSETRSAAAAAFSASARAVVGLDTDTAIQTEPSAVVPGEHVLGVMGLQQAVAAKVTKDPLADGVLEAIQELGRETGGFVEAEATGLGFGVLIWTR